MYLFRRRPPGRSYLSVSLVKKKKGKKKEHQPSGECDHKTECFITTIIRPLPTIIIIIIVILPGLMDRWIKSSHSSKLTSPRHAIAATNGATVRNRPWPRKGERNGCEKREKQKESTQPAVVEKRGIDCSGQSRIRKKKLAPLAHV
ncbi:hypothetical protein ZHAS_00008873 [Anopheles sinensis]|uniref:Uncharacterized protein n=1 Tax=Anopheles sinensis TaxID=74873 RepID=A0A084VTI7_ANOSI|nr:hypothetical protein ZHAS_00008873 [Anopheles sinensis]